jgi:ADP-heptose:LPS heptosyltransferase
VAVVFCDKVGAIVVASPLMRGLRERYPDIILDYFGGERMRELEDASPLVDWRYSLFGREDALEALPASLVKRRRTAGDYALAINLEFDPIAAQACGLIWPRFVAGPWIHPASGGRADPPSDGIDGLWHDVWNRPDLLQDYPLLETQFIGEIFAKLARVQTDFTRVEAPTAAPPFRMPRVLMATGGNRSAKLWPTTYWRTVARWLDEQGHTFGLVGAAPTVQRSAYHAGDVDTALIADGAVDLRGTLTLPQVAGALQQAQAFLTVDNGLMHLAAAVDAPTIALFGASPRRIWAPRQPSVRILDPSNPCTLCEENRFRNEACLLSVHQCMESIEPDRVIVELGRLLGRHGG